MLLGSSAVPRRRARDGRVRDSVQRLRPFRVPPQRKAAQLLSHSYGLLMSCVSLAPSNRVAVTCADYAFTTQFFAHLHPSHCFKPVQSLDKH
jgi:hypothetical protein